MLAKKMQVAKNKHTNPNEQLKTIAATFWDFASRHKEHYQLMYGQGMMGCEIEKCLPERTEFRSIVLEPIQELMSKKKKQEANDCLKYYTFWSILHGLISMKNMRGVGVSDEINKMVMDDAIDGFIKNLS